MELPKRTKFTVAVVDMKDFLDEFGIQTKQALNDLDAGKILYLWSYDLKNKMVHLYLGNAVNLGIPVELPEIEVLAAFDYVREPKYRSNNRCPGKNQNSSHNSN